MKIVRFFAKVVVGLALANFVAFGTIHVLTHGNMFGSASGLVIGFASFPRTVKLVLDQITAPVAHYQLSVDKKFEPKNALDNDIYALTSHYNATADTLRIELLNLKTDAMIHTWAHGKSTREINGSHINHPLLLDDYSVAYKLENSLYRMDAESKLLWKNEEVKFHHSLEQDHEGYLWSPANVRNGELDLNRRLPDPNKKLVYKDELIVKVDPVTGKIVYSKSLSEIFLENNYSGLVKGFWQYDPIHLNDIEPVLEDSRYWKKGDLFLSCRNLHTVVLYRPATGKIIWLKTGLWANQHDVDIIDSARISIFDNNINMSYYEVLHKENAGGSKEKTIALEGLHPHNQIVIYDFAADSISYFLKEAIAREKIDTESQGVYTPLGKQRGFIEETDEGKIYILSDSVTEYKAQFVSPNGKFSFYPGWTRVYEKLPSKK
jgi:hypothetical protein